FRLVPIPISPYEWIASRQFKLKKETFGRWVNAGHYCRAYDGYLATIQNEEELTAISAKLNPDDKYWLGIFSNNGGAEFLSEATMNPATFFKWNIENRNAYNNSSVCVYLLNGLMNTGDCTDVINFICQ
ncbi:hypothetical protein KR084_009886, partial [Drosophila pseudotakahashii]